VGGGEGEGGGGAAASVREGVREGGRMRIVKEGRGEWRGEGF